MPFIEHYITWYMRLHYYMHDASRKKKVIKI